MRKHKKSKEKLSRRKTELLLSVVFTGLMCILSFSDITYIPISDTRLLDMSLVPIIFVAMIGGYSVAIPVGVGWAISAMLNQPGDHYSWEWIMITKLSFSVSLVFFYALSKRMYPYSPLNVHRTIIAAVTLKNIVVSIAIIAMFPNLELHTWARDTLIQFLIEMSICLLSMSLLIEKLRKIHILNGVRRKQKQERN